MCRSLKRSTYAAVKILVELCSQLKAVNAKSAEINTHLSYCIFDFFYILKARHQKAVDLRLTSFYYLTQKPICKLRKIIICFQSQTLHFKILKPDSE